MSVIAKVRNELIKFREGESFSAANFRHLGSSANIRKVLSRLVAAGEVQRLTRGVFIKTKASMDSTSVMFSTQELIEKVTVLTGETITIHGAEAARRLELSTQMQVKPVFYTTGRTRTINVSNRKISLVHINKKKIIPQNALINMVMLALNYLGEKNVSYKVLDKIKIKIGNDEFTNLKSQVKYMPLWMADVFYHYGKKSLLSIKQ